MISDDNLRADKKLKRKIKSVDIYTDDNQQKVSKKPKVAGPGIGVTIYEKKAGIPERTSNGELNFPDFPHFRPNLTPKEVLQMGSFGGTYFRPIRSSVTGVTYSNTEWQELPTDWFEGLNIKTQVTAMKYNTNVNKYKVNCGGDLEMWESSGWITHIDPYGWFQWYCRFYQG